MSSPLPRSAWDDISANAARWVARRDAGLTPEEARDFDAWLAADARHAAAFRHFTAAWSVLDRSRLAGVSAEVIETVRVRRARRRRRLALAAGAGLCCAVAGLLWHFQPAGSTEPLPAGAATAIVRRPEVRELPDGSRLELRPGARVDVRFAPARREVHLEAGEVLFTVAPDATRPFVVRAGALESRAVGTAFLVSLSSSAVELVVTEGRVAARIDRPSPTAPAEDVIVAPGGKVLVPAAGTSAPAAPEVSILNAAEMAVRLAWRSVQLEFTGTPLAEAVALMNRGDGSAPASPRLALDPATPELGAVPVSGIFYAGNSAAFVRMLEISLGLHATTAADGTIVLRRAP